MHAGGGWVGCLAGMDRVGLHPYHGRMHSPLFRKLADTGPPCPAVSLTVDGQAIEAQAGDTVASALLRLDPPRSRTTPVKGSARAPFCMMGVCFECLAVVDGLASTQTCLVTVRPGMRVQRQHGRPVPDAGCGPVAQWGEVPAP